MNNFFSVSRIFFFYLIFSFSSCWAQVVSVTVESTSAQAQTNIHTTFGQVFAKGEVNETDNLTGSINGTQIPLQVNKKAVYNDGSLRHAILTANIGALTANDSQIINIATGSSNVSETPITKQQVLNTGYDVSVALNISGVSYSASAKNILSTSQSKTWLSGSLATEWIVSAPLLDSNNNEHPRLMARFYIRAYDGLQSIRTEVVIENNWTFQPSPTNIQYNVSVDVEGQGSMLSEAGITHYNQSRWRRVFWWNNKPEVHVQHDQNYLMKTGAIPSYDATLVLPESRLDDMVNYFEDGDNLMEIGYMEPDMSVGGGRPDIGPLPRWASRYLISQKKKAKDVMIGHGEQSGSWPIHYRDVNTNLPVSIDTYPQLTIQGSNPIFPDCAGDCDTPYTPDVSHLASLSYVPYLITGDYFHLEELQFWANWIMFYGPAHRHDFAKGLISWDQVRGQAWGVRTLAHAAYITPDDDSLKDYFIEKLQNNITFYNDNWLDWNPLGYIMNPDWLPEPSDRQISTWMDDFLTWSFGHLVALDFEEARPFANFKAKFPIGRMTHDDTCWIMATTYWPTIKTPFPATSQSKPVDTWSDYYEVIIRSWNDNSMRSLGIDITGQEDALLNSPCNSQEMATILDVDIGEMIGVSYSPEGYPSNLQPALAVALELNVPGAQEAWDVFESRSVKPWWLSGEGGGYDDHPHWAIVPSSSKNGGGLAVEDVDGAQDFIIYPSPTKDVIHMVSKSAINILKVNIYNIDGKLVFTNKPVINNTRTSTLDVSDISSGFYIVQIISEDGLIVKKIVKE